MFQKGISGNPRGKLKGTKNNLEKAARKRAFDLLFQEHKERLLEALDKVDPVLVKKAVEGNVPAISEFYDRAVGKPVQRHDLTSDGKPIPILGTLINKKGNDERAG